MTRESELMLYALLALPAAVVGFVLLLMGPVGWFVAGFLGIAVIGVAAMRGESNDGDDPDRTNCTHCGSRTAADDACEYCGEPP
ncbi:hypothetical protein ACFR97_02525 [Haloplanus litoreus]|uniref:Zinc-ribbon domain-containing protein n=1 Tax=Haloplanus litoreus TaxID=767515 RepID=A0ABD6A0P6_9EURY